MSNPQDEFAPRRAVKSQVRLKMAVQGPSGSGKTESALALATHLLAAMGFTTPEQLEGKICLIDTENESASLYAIEPGNAPGPGQYIFDTIPLAAPYTPARYIKAMRAAVAGKYLVLVADTISHEWEGSGGILRQKDLLDTRPNANSYTNWAELTPQHDSFIEFVKALPIHTICTMRTKQSYVLEANNKGKMVPRKVGMAPVQREGAEYEFTLVFDLSMDHVATTSKNRTGLFIENGLPVQLNLTDPEVAQEVYTWLTSGAPLVDKLWDSVNAKKEPSPPASTRKAPAPPAPKPAENQFIKPNARQVFWIEAKKNGKGDEDLRIWLWETFQITSTNHIPYDQTTAAIEWAKLPKVERVLEPGERNARDAAEALTMNERDIRDALAEQGTWDLLADDLRARVDEATMAAEAAKAAAETP